MEAHHTKLKVADFLPGVLTKPDTIHIYIYVYIHITYIYICIVPYIYPHRFPSISHGTQEDRMASRVCKAISSGCISSLYSSP